MGATEPLAEANEQEGETVALTKDQIEKYLREVGAELEKRGFVG